MPYKKYNKYKKKNQFARYVPSLTTAHKALQIALATKKLLNVEHKTIDSAAIFQTVSASGFIIPLTNTQQGTTSVSRDGDQIKVTSIYWKYWLSFNTAASFSFVRCMLIQDKQTNSAQFTAADVLNDVSSGNVAIVSPLNLDNKYRFKVLYDKVHKLNDNSGNLIQYKELYKKVDLRIRYDGNIGDITDLSSNSYSLLMISNQTGNMPSITSYTRVRYVDN